MTPEDESSNAALPHRVLGTAGHIDHGKTSLVRALTGIETDRLPEEKKRGITIELGFASWTLDDALTCSVIDVPGHEKFVRTMVAGAAGIDAVLLVVAADDAVMPQTREHLAVCSLLGVKTGVVALTKADLVDEEMRELVAADIADSLAGTFLEDAPVVPVSSITGEGIDALAESLKAVLLQVPAREDTGAAYLGVDRVFSRAGFGTVVTGTLLGGALAVGESVDFIPGAREAIHVGAKIRGLEVHNQKVEVAPAGRRCAVNLRGVEADEVPRGSVLCAHGTRAPTRAVHVELTLLDDAPPLRERDELSLHVGTVDELVHAVVLDRKGLLPGETGLVRLKSERAFLADAGARYVVRKPGLHGHGTVGGGRVLDPHPTEGKGSFSRWGIVAKGLAAPTLEANVGALLLDARNEGIAVAALQSRLPRHHSREEIETAAGDAGGIEVAIANERRFIEAQRVEAVAADVLDLVDQFHKEHPFLSGPSPREFEGRVVGVRALLAGAALDHLVAAATLVRDGAVVHRAGHTPDAAVLDRVVSLYSAGGLAPAADFEISKQCPELAASELRDVITELKRRNRLSPVADLHFDTSALHRLAVRVVGHLKANDTLATGDLKELAGGVSRKFAIPLLEWLDQAGVTARKGDVRVAGSKADAAAFAAAP